MIKIVSSERYNKLKDKVKFLEKEVEHLKGQKQAVLKINEELRNSKSKKEQELRDVYRSKKLIEKLIEDTCKKKVIDLQTKDAKND